MAIAHGAAAGALRFRQWFALHLALHATLPSAIGSFCSVYRAYEKSAILLIQWQGQKSTGIIVKLYGCLMSQIYLALYC